MLLKLALRNIKRSVRDYAIYFVTLAIGVAVFYAFNSIEGQQVLLDLQTEADHRQFEMAQGMLSLFSGLIACVLGFLVIYTNRFLIRRRKREFGTYLLLGMSSVSVSGIVLIETLVVGVFALLVGTLLGLLLSQVLSFATAALFGVHIKNYQFIFSPDALLTTLGCFAIIFAIVAVFNAFSVNRYKLIDLMAADKKNERGGVRNPWLCLVVFIVSIVCLAYAYTQLIESGLVMLDDPRFIRATIFMLIGSLLFFWSLAGFIIAVITRAKGIYLRGLTMFTVRQIASKVNTAFASFWVICVMLFFSITVFSSGMGMVQIFAGDMEKWSPYDATIVAQVWQNTPRDAIRPTGDEVDLRAREMQEQAPERYAQGMSYGWNIAAPLSQNDPEQWDKLVKACAQVDTYDLSGVTYQPLVDEVINKNPNITVPSELSGALNSNISTVRISQLNDLRNIVGKDPIALGEDQGVVVNNMSMTEELAKAIASSRSTLTYGGRTFTLLPEVDDTQIMNSSMSASALIVALPDDLIDDLVAQGAIPLTSYLNIDYYEEGEPSDLLLNEIIAKTQPKSLGGFDRGSMGAQDPYASLLWPVTSVNTRVDMFAQSNGLKLMITYLALYIGFIFLMSTATILAIQQLSEAADSLPRYQLLNKLGCDRSMIGRSLFAQILICFLLPLGLAVCHSACAIGVLNESLFRPMGIYSLTPIFMAAALVLVVYGVYLLITYLVSRSFVNAQLSS